MIFRTLDDVYTRVRCVKKIDLYLTLLFYRVLILNLKNERKI